jgi:hypothetical protein
VLPDSLFNHFVIASLEFIVYMFSVLSTGGRKLGGLLTKSGVSWGFAKKNTVFLCEQLIEYLVFCIFWARRSTKAEWQVRWALGSNPGLSM